MSQPNQSSADSPVSHRTRTADTKLLTALTQRVTELQEQLQYLQSPPALPTSVPSLSDKSDKLISRLTDRGMIAKDSQSYTSWRSEILLMAHERQWVTPSYNLLTTPLLPNQSHLIPRRTEAFTVLRNTICPSLISSLLPSDPTNLDPSVIWSAAALLFEPTSGDTLYHASRKFFTATQSRGEPLITFLPRIEDLRRTVTRLGGVISDDVAVSAVTNACAARHPAASQSAFTLYEASLHSASPWSYDQYRMTLLAHSLRHRDPHRSASASPAEPQHPAVKGVGDTAPVCRDYLAGECTRRRCRYAHPSPRPHPDVGRIPRVDQIAATPQTIRLLDNNADNHVQVQLILDCASSFHLLPHSLRPTSISSHDTVATTVAGITRFGRKGDFRFRIPSSTQTYCISDAVISPDNKTAILSLGLLARAGYSFHGSAEGLTLYSPSRTRLFTARLLPNSQFAVAVAPAATASRPAPSLHHTPPPPAAIHATSNATSVSPQKVYDQHVADMHVAQSTILKRYNWRLRDNTSFIHCDACARGKSVAPPAHPPSRDTDLRTPHRGHWNLDIHPAPAPASTGHRYYALAVNDHGRLLWHHLLLDKTAPSLLSMLQSLDRFTSTTLETKFRLLHTDNESGITRSTASLQWLREHNITLSTSPPYHQQSNGVAERWKRTVSDAIRTTLLHANSTPAKYWPYALAAACRTLNASPTSANPGSISPNSATLPPTSPPPSTINTYPLFCLCYAHIHVNEPERRTQGPKTGPRARRCAYLGPDPTSHGHLVLDLVSNRVLTRRHIHDVRPDTFPLSNPPAPLDGGSHDDDDEYEVERLLQHRIADDGSTEYLVQWVGYDPIHNSWEPKANLQCPELLRQYHASNTDPAHPSSRVDTITTLASNTFPDIDLTGEVHPSAADDLTEAACFATAFATDGPDAIKDLCANLAKQYRLQPTDIQLTHTQNEHLTTLIKNLSDPTSTQEALSGPLGHHALEAIRKELCAMYSLNVLRLIPPSEVPRGAKIMRSKMLYKIKRTANGAFDKFKARLVYQGLQSLLKIPASECFAPTLHADSLRLLFAVAAQFKCTIDKADIRNFYLQGRVPKKLYMRQPKDLEQHPADHVYEVYGNIYGNPTAGKVANADLRRRLLSIGLQQSVHDPAIFFMRQDHGFLIVGDFVDDLLIISNSSTLRQRFHDDLHHTYTDDLTWASQPDDFLGLQIQYGPDGAITIHQQHFIEEALLSADLHQCRPATTPISPSKVQPHPAAPLTPTESEKARSHIGQIMWLLKTRPDIAHAAHVISQDMAKPNEETQAKTKQIFRYLAGTKSLGLTYRPGVNNIVAHHFEAAADSSFADGSSGESTYGYQVTLAGAPIIFRARKTKGLTPQSTTEAETYSCSECVKDVTWIRNVWHELGFEQLQPTTVWQDNAATLKLSHNAVMHARTKHFRARQGLIRSAIEAGVIETKYLPTTEMPADIYTKALHAPAFLKWRKNVMGG